MSQSEIIKLLEKNGEMSCEELTGELKISFNAVARSLMRLLRAREIERTSKSKEEVTQEGKHFTGRSLVWKIQK